MTNLGHSVSLYVLMFTHSQFAPAVSEQQFVIFHWHSMFVRHSFLLELKNMMRTDIAKRMINKKITFIFSTLPKKPSTLYVI